MLPENSVVDKRSLKLIQKKGKNILPVTEELIIKLENSTNFTRNY